MYEEWLKFHGSFSLYKMRLRRDVMAFYGFLMKSSRRAGVDLLSKASDRL